MTRYIPSRAPIQETRVEPGPVEGGACPPPSEIMVIEANKVYDFCFQEDTLERSFFVSGLGAGAKVQSCTITEATCQEIMEREPLPEKDGLALVSIQVNLELTITILPSPNANPITVVRRVAFPKRVVLCAPMGTDIKCDVRGTCICMVQPPTQDQAANEPNVFCTIQLCITLQAVADVKILVPTFGIVVPQRCKVAPVFGGCPPLPPAECEPLVDP